MTRLLLRGAAIVGGGLVLLVALAFGGGAMRPREHVAEGEALIDAPADAVWARLADLDAAPTWRSDVDAVTRLEDGRVEERGEHGTTIYRVLEQEAPTRRVVEAQDPDGYFGGTWTFTLTARGDRTLVQIREDGWVDSPPFRLLSRFVFGHETSLRGYLADLAASFR